MNAVEDTCLSLADATYLPWDPHTVLYCTHRSAGKGRKLVADRPTAWQWVGWMGMGRGGEGWAGLQVPCVYVMYEKVHVQEQEGREREGYVM